MNTPSFLQEPQLISLQTLFSDLRTGALLVPRFQREFIWDSVRRISLLDSIKKGIPLGSLLVWRTTVKMATFPRIGGVEIPKNESLPWQYLLDGHQRVSTLFSAFQQSGKERDDHLEDWELTPGDIVYDLEDECFLLAKDHNRKKNRQVAIGLPLYLLFTGAPYLKFLRENYVLNNAEVIQRADILAEKFRNYKMPVVPIVTDDLETALTAFQRINSSGVIMSDAHIVHALSYSDNFDLMAQLNQAQEDLKDVGWDELDHKYILAVVRALNDLGVTSPAAEETSKILKAHPEFVKQATDSIRKVADWLWNECRIASPSFLPYSYQLPLIASIFNGLSDKEMNQKSKYYRTWFWKASLTGIFRNMRENEYIKARENLKSESPTFEAIDRNKNVGITKGKYNFQRARVKLVMLRMLDRRLKGKDAGIIEDARCYLRQSGSASMTNLFRKNRASNSDAGTKFMAIRTGEEKGFQDFSEMPEALMDELLITNKSLIKIQQGKFDEFFAERTREVEQLETDFIKEVGLRISDTDERDF